MNTNRERNVKKNEMIEVLLEESKKNLEKRCEANGKQSGRKKRLAAQ